MTSQAPPCKRPWVLMDAGDTFIYGYPTLYQAIADCLTASGDPADVKEIEAHVKEYLKKNDRAQFIEQHQFENFFRGLYGYVLEQLHYSRPTKEGVDFLWGEWERAHRFRLFDDARAGLDMLKQANLKLGTVSNWDNSFHRLLENLEITSYFECAMASCQVGLAKPDPAFFQYALDQVGIRGEQAWFLGDGEKVDIAPAASLGMRTILVDYYGRSKGNSQADFVEPSFSLAAKRILDEEYEGYES